MTQRGRREGALTLAALFCSFLVACSEVGSERYICGFFTDGSGPVPTAFTCNIAAPSQSHSQVNITIKTHFHWATISESSYNDASLGVIYATAYNYSATPAGSQEALLVISAASGKVIHGYTLPNRTSGPLLFDDARDRLLFLSYTSDLDPKYVVSFHPYTGQLAALFPVPLPYYYKPASLSFNPKTREVAGIFYSEQASGPTFLAMDVDTGITTRNVSISMSQLPDALYFDNEKQLYYSLFADPELAVRVQLMLFDPDTGTSHQLPEGSPVVVLPSTLIIANAIVDSQAGILYVFSSSPKGDWIEAVPLSMANGQLAGPSPFVVSALYGMFLMDM